MNQVTLMLIMHMQRLTEWIQFYRRNMKLDINALPAITSVIVIIDDLLTTIEYGYQ